ncbi:hypothetical protein BDZ94DRAFT_1311111 [Collybia nuda]|uniref:Uncharacterized protein n=1 Tax=Collybia nuda TaxID=64659 RepID=A0A9P5Y490_9AGAR|nr:hypothetical protein BDZ94DRAFT_1311111 [Collybia nuda]
MSHAGGVSIVDVSLATVCIESLLYGMVCVLFAASTYLHIARQRSRSNSRGSRTAVKSRVPRRAILHPIFLGTIFIYMCVTAHWIISVYRLFQAFKLFNGGKTPAALYGNLSQATNVAKTAFVLAAVLTGDAMLIYRLYIVWNFDKTVVALPMFTFLGLTACAVGLTYQFSRFQPGMDVFNSDAGRWIISDIVFTLWDSTNVYCTVMIAFRIWRVNVASRKFGGGSLTSVSAMIVESAAIYAAWSVFFLAVYESHSTVQFFTVDTIGQISAIATLLINVRVGLGWAHKPSEETISSITVNFRQETTGPPVRSILTHVSPPNHGDGGQATSGFELDTVQSHWPVEENISKA